MKKSNPILPLLTGLHFLLTAAVIVLLVTARFGADKAAPKGNETVDYTLYIGLNDKQTNTQRIAVHEAREIVDAICLDHVDGFTVTEAQGAWTDEDGTLIRENTLVYLFSDTDEPQIVAIMDEVLTALNQSTIFVRVDTVETVYYTGTEEIRG